MQTLHELVGQFEAFLITERRVAENTLLAYRRDIAQLEEFLIGGGLGFSDNKNSKPILSSILQKTSLQKTSVTSQETAKQILSITKNDLSAFIKFLKNKGLNAKSQSRKISTIKLFYRYLSDVHHVPNIAKNIVFPKIDKTLPCYLTQQETEQLLAAANLDLSDKGIRNKVMLYLLYASGVRVSELVNMTLDQLLFDVGFVRIVGKGSKERMVALPKNILELLRYYIEQVYPRLLPAHAQQLDKKKQYLFVAVYGNKIGPVSRQSFWLCLKKILTHATIHKNVSPHALRHSLATHLLQQGADLRSLQLLLGHQNLATVQIYTHLGNTHVRQVYDKKHPRAR